VTPEQFLEIARVLPEPMCLVSGDGQLLAANPALAALMGLPLDALRAHALFDFVADPPEKIKDYLSACSQSSALIPGSLRLRLADGDSFQAGCEGAAVNSQEDAKPQLILLRFQIEEPVSGNLLYLNRKIEELGQEIEQRRIEDELRATEYRFTMFTENLPGLAWIKDMEGRYVYANEAAVKAFRTARSELYGKTDDEIFPPETAALFKKNDQLALSDGVGVQTIETLEQEDGVHHSLISKFPIPGPTGETVMVGGIAIDITERKRAQEELERSEEKYRSLLENANDIIYSHDLQGNYLTINRACEEVTGYTRKEILGGLNIAQVVVPEHLELAKEMTRRKLIDPSPTVYEVDIFTKDRRRITLEISTRIAFRDGQPVAVEGIGRDVTERKRIERAREELLEREQQARLELEEASRMKDEFLATVSHELRTPLTAMLGWSHLLRTGKLDEQSATHAIETIERNARSQAQLIEDLLDVSRIITGNLRLDVRPVEPVGIIEGALEAVRPAAEAKGVRLEKSLDTNISSVFGDPTRLQQVVWNLLANAIKFTPRGGQVSIRVERTGSHVRIVVADTGEGISADFLPYVFDRFRQADAKTTRRHGGLGLGLAIVRHLVEMHGGTVNAESPGEDQGATFTVSLPLMPVYQRSSTPELSAHSMSSSHFLPLECPERLDGLKVLAVDDEADTREVLRTAFEQCGAKVTTAASASEALALIEEWRPDVLISDIGMPEEDGYELISQVRALPAERGGRTPAVALTAYARAEDRLRALRTGYQMHVSKPVELAELVAIVARLIER
jgi:PAS domain S-box-containing protein